VIEVTLNRLAGYRCSRRGRPTTLNYSLNRHAPDQTGRRPQLVHCDCASPFRTDAIAPLTSMTFRGPQALKDS